MPSRKTVMPACWLASLAIHALACGWLARQPADRVASAKVKATPLPPAWEPERAPAEASLPPLPATPAEALRSLEAARRELAALEAAKREEYRQATKFPALSPDEITAAQREAAKAQSDALAALKRASAKSASDQAASARAPDLIESAASSREAQTHQAKALESLARADARYERAYQAQSAANSAQLRASQTRAEAESLRAEADSLARKNAPAEDDLREAREMLSAAETQLAAAKADAARLGASLPALDAAADAAKTAAEAALADTDKQRAVVAKKALADAQKAAANARKNLARARSDIAKFEKRVTEQAARVAKFSEKQAPLAGGSDTLTREAAQKLAEAETLMTEAADLQARASEALESALAAPEPGPAPAEPPAAPASDSEDLAALYQSAVQTEKELAESYRRLRATDLALRRGIPLGRALELTDSARAQRPDLSSALAGSDDAARGGAKNQISAIHSLADSMLDQARGLATGTDRRLALERMAVEDDGERAKDLTLAMLGADEGAGQDLGGEGAGGNPGEGQAGSGPPDSTGSRAGDSGGAGGKSGGAGSGQGGSGQGGSGGKGPGGGGGGAGQGSGRGGSGGAGGGGSGSGGRGNGGSGFGFGSGSGSGPGSGPPGSTRTIAAAPGRIVGPGMVPGRWMFVDSWYLIGPFDNEGRVNIDKQFPPESIVDLDATYLGKRGQPLRWEFYQSPEARIIPPFDSYNPQPAGATDLAFKTRGLEYIIYYAYTELRAIEACDVWIAVGSDDFSKLWIEDQLVWASGKQHKSWRLDEGYRKVRLKKGVNRVLLRVENGHSRTDFSLILSAP